VEDFRKKLFFSPYNKALSEVAKGFKNGSVNCFV
jgi:hypothetical protein